MRAEDEREFTELVVAVSPRLLRTAYAVCGDLATAQDAVQSALATTFRSWPTVRDADNPQAYLRRMVLNELFFWRRRVSWRTTSVRAEVPDVPVDSAEDAVLDRQVVWAAMSQLPPRQRAVVVLRYYEDLSEAEIAATLGIRPGTVKSQCAAGMAHLRQTLVRAEISPAGTQGRGR